MRRPAHGFTLLEVMVAMGILLVGLLGLMRLQILGLSWNQSARTHSRAMELALELRAGLEQLPWGDPRLNVTGGGTWGSTAPTPFGALLGVASGFTAWSDTNAIPGVTLDSALGPEPTDPSQPLFQRKWTVWGYSNMASVGAGAGALVIAISVIYVDRGSLQPREVVVYTERANPAAVLSSLRISS